MIKVSAIVPVYNSEKYLDKCIQSILNQTLKDFEILIINDGSFDKSHDIISKYNDSRIKYFKRKNHGIGNSRNFGIEKSNGKYICFIDSDDFIHQSMFEEMYKKCESEQLDFLICDYYHYLENSQSIKKFKLSKFKNTTLNNSPQLILDINLGPCNKFIKKDLFNDESMKFPENIKYEDMPLILKLLSKAKKIGKLSEPLCYFMVHDNSETTTVDQRTFDIFKVLKMINSYFNNNNNIKPTLEILNIKKITMYTIQQRYQDDKIIRNQFIEDAFQFLNNNFPNWKKSKYFSKRNLFKRLIEKNKFLTKIYCNLYNNFK